MTVSLLNQPIRVASPADAMLLAVHHSIRDDLRPASTVRDLCDLQTWWSVAERWSTSTVLDLARTIGLEQPLLALWNILSQYDSESSTAASLASLTQTLSSAELSTVISLSHLFEWQLQGDRVNRDLLHMLNLSTVKRFIQRRLQTLWGIRHDRNSTRNKVYQLLKDLIKLNRSKLNAYKALSQLQEQKNWTAN